MSLNLKVPKLDSTPAVAGAIVIGAILLLAVTRHGLPSPS